MIAMLKPIIFIVNVNLSNKIAMAYFHNGCAGHSDQRG